LLGTLFILGRPLSILGERGALLTTTILSASGLHVIGISIIYGRHSFNFEEIRKLKQLRKLRQPKLF